MVAAAGRQEAENLGEALKAWFEDPAHPNSYTMATPSHVRRAAWDH
jgi:hypothetical protein